MKDCPMCGVPRNGEPDIKTHFCVECYEKIEDVLWAGFEGCEYSPPSRRAQASNFWNNRMMWVLGELFYRVSSAEDSIFRLEKKIIEDKR